MCTAQGRCASDVAASPLSAALTWNLMFLYVTVSTLKPMAAGRMHSSESKQAACCAVVLG